MHFQPSATLCQSWRLLDLEFDRATVNVKVVELKEEMQVGGKLKMDVIIADGSGKAMVSVREGE